jgi:hypothetical protein
MKSGGLKREMDEGFARGDQCFDEVNQRFDAVNTAEHAGFSRMLDDHEVV